MRTGRPSAAGGGQKQRIDPDRDHGGDGHHGADFAGDGGSAWWAAGNGRAWNGQDGHANSSGMMDLLIQARQGGYPDTGSGLQGAGGREHLTRRPQGRLGNDYPLPQEGGRRGGEVYGAERPAGGDGNNADLSNRHHTREGGK